MYDWESDRVEPQASQRQELPRLFGVPRTSCGVTEPRRSLSSRTLRTGRVTSGAGCAIRAPSRLVVGIESGRGHDVDTVGGPTESAFPCGAGRPMSYNDTYLMSFDPRAEQVVLSDTGWAHILAEHAEFLALDPADDFSPLEETIERPDAIMQDVTHRNRHNYYRRDEMPGYPGFFLKIVVEWRPSGWTGVVGLVITAFVLARIKRGEVQVWP